MIAPQRTRQSLVALSLLSVCLLTLSAWPHAPAQTRQSSPQAADPRQRAARRTCTGTFLGEWSVPRSREVRLTITRLDDGGAAGVYRSGQAVINLQGPVQGNVFSGRWQLTERVRGNFRITLSAARNSVEAYLESNERQLVRETLVCTPGRPPRPRPTPTPTPTPTPFPPTPFPPTPEPPTPEPPTQEPTRMPTPEPTPTPTPTPTPSPTPEPTSTPTPEPTATPAATPTPTRDTGDASEAFDADNFRRFDALPKEEQARLLDEHGPRLPAQYNLSDLSWRAFVQGGWPVVIDYGLGPDASAELIIEVEGVALEILKLPPRPLRDPLRFVVPGKFGPERRVAKLRVRAFTRAGKPAPLSLFGVGMGERGVRAAALPDAPAGPPFVAFRLASLAPAPPAAVPQGTSIQISVPEPTAIRSRARPRQFITFNCSPRDDFDNGRWEMWRVNGFDWTHAWSSARIGSLSRNRQVRGTWDGRASGGATSAGDHSLQLTAWRGRERDGNWVVARSESRLFVE